VLLPQAVTPIITTIISYIKLGFGVLNQSSN